MTAAELYQLGEKAYAEDRYEDALRYYTAAAPQNVDAAATVPLCHMGLASQVSLDASEHAGDTEYLVRGQQLAVKVYDTAIRSALALYRDYPDYPYVCNVAPLVICTSLNAQYSLVSTGLTTAYRITSTTTTVRKTVMQTKQGGQVINQEVLWEDVIGRDTDSFISLTSYNMSDYHIFGPDEKTKQVRQSLNTILYNAVQVAGIMEAIGREYDANILRASMACAMAEADGGDRSMLLSAEWFIARAREQAKAAIKDQDVLENWLTSASITVDDYNALSRKYAALLRTYRRKGQKPHLAKFYADPSQAPAVESSAEYAREQESRKANDSPLNGMGDSFQVFLTVFAQITFTKVFPTILFASFVSLFCGGLFRVFSEDVNIFGVIWFILTIGLTFFRSIMNSDEFRTHNTFRIYMATMMGTAVLFSINFWAALAIYLVLHFMAKKYK